METTKVCWGNFGGSGKESGNYYNRAYIKVEDSRFRV